ncbi:hypothetical protein [Nitrosomonas supralitoralis]|uniref:Uncharacterized protein n=1 Tax=Nitrosomonas supralitoralis TaxID=2116706 RepID=A0A2P7NWV1_9PROT|nr:hypothetical protein [Nitrosomonas supralitoralis]PSJ17931.1 hypothetical protein C7H79_05270 [Nitrosomonas supralitoralis]
MSRKRHDANLKALIIIISFFLSAFYANAIFSQTSKIEHNYPLPPKTQDLITQSLPETPPDSNKPQRTIHRIGTAIRAPRNSISIKSTDAGMIRRQLPASGCANCGIINFINTIGQGPGMNAIAGGIIAGTVAREIIRQTPHSHATSHPQVIGGNHGNYEGNIAYPGNQYQIGITMDDGRQAIIALPEGTNLQQGDRVKWIDGTLILDRQ